jgi:hypothetical protein
VVLIIGDAVPGQNANAGIDETICPGETIFLNASDPAPATGVWTTSDPLVIFQDETNPNTGVLPLPSGSYTMYWTLSYATCVDYSTDSVIINLINVPIAAPDTVNVPFGQTSEFNVLLNDSTFNEPYTLHIGTNPQKGNALHAGEWDFQVYTEYWVCGN